MCDIEDTSRAIHEVGTVVSVMMKDQPAFLEKEAFKKIAFCLDLWNCLSRQGCRSFILQSKSKKSTTI